MDILCNVRTKETFRATSISHEAVQVSAFPPLANIAVADATVAKVRSFYYTDKV